MKDELKAFQPAVEGDCPCGGSFTVGYARKDGKKTPAILHTVPWCVEFEVLEVDEYLSWLRMRAMN